jgi:hypothetical protein
MQRDDKNWQKIMDIWRIIQRGSEPGRADLLCSLPTDRDVSRSKDRGSRKADAEEPERVLNGQTNNIIVNVKTELKFDTLNQITYTNESNCLTWLVGPVR